MTEAPGGYVEVPAGPFTYGPEVTYERLEIAPPRRPVERVELDRFWIARRPVTNRDWHAFLVDTDYTWEGSWWRVARPSRFTWRRAFEPTATYPAGHEALPVVDVSQDDAYAYCAWESARIGLRCTLPTEEQWEKAARGTDGRRFPWGEEAPRPEIQWQRRFPVGPETYCFSLLVPPQREIARAGWYWRNGFPRPVGGDPRNVSPYGCVDMSGNVWEWTSSRYNPGEPAFHVVKGGSWGYSVHHTCCNVRSASSITTPSRAYRAQGTGFRVCIDDPE